MMALVSLFTDRSYIGRAKCGCIVAAIGIPNEDAPQALRDEVAQEVGALIADGLTVEQVSDETVRAEWALCPHHGQQLGLPLEGGAA